MTRLFLILTFIILTSFTACKNFYNDTIKWADSIENGTDIQTVKKNQPEFIEVAWNNPDTISNEILYEIIKIKGSNDPLHMQHFLTFIDNKYVGRKARK